MIGSRDTGREKTEYTEGQRDTTHKRTKKARIRTCLMNESPSYDFINLLFLPSQCKCLFDSLNIMEQRSLNVIVTSF
jgi:hypothetical protein